jgi:hypothetical protein
MSMPGTVVVSSHWHARSAELSYAIRCVAGAASRCAPVSVLVPGARSRRTEADGAFDLEAIGQGSDLQWPEHLDPNQTVVVDELTPEVSGMLSAARPRAVLYLSAPGGRRDAAWQRLHLIGEKGVQTSPSFRVHIPVNRLAQLDRHHGFGFTGYQLLLSDRSEPCNNAPPEAAWVSSAFHDAWVVVVENAVASAWKGRALRGEVRIDTRMDLWRLVAHANACIDLAPGPYIARECVEALRFGTPIVVPEQSGPAAAHARAVGGSTFADPGELVSAVAKLLTEANRSGASEAGRHYADDRFGNPRQSISDMKALLATS